MYRFDQNLMIIRARLVPLEQNTMGLPLEKKTGTNFGPPGNSKLVYFLDDLNLSEVQGFMKGSGVSEIYHNMEFSVSCRYELSAEHCTRCLYISRLLTLAVHATHAHAVFRLTRTTPNRLLLSFVSTWNTNISTIWPNSA